ncbi:amidohydrolase family protein [Falsiroseomonas sp.]|uniref:metal-dependent hydrolase family protein n=1 Tax=Falsiroseomonas sp. TaxID=2870721 RepID=UPI0027272DAC|nr:amidohydrolase family protein [Falsiroseomonas sp.]MDO9501597.1 amidohydrolase family protein [Falsiroseomonas sp.]
MTADLSRRMVLGGAAAMLAPFLAARDGAAQPVPPAASERPTLLTNLRLFDGQARTLRQGVHVLIRGKRIEALPAADAAVEGAQTIDCGGRLVMPGLIDAHFHTMLCGITMPAAMGAEVAFIHLVAAREAERTLLRGFTTVRDAGGPSFALKRAIDMGIMNGPRIYPSGALISQTSGHGDFRLRHELPRGTTTPLSHPELAGMAAIADGEAEVLRRVREQLMLGASQVKLMGGGGVASTYDPIDTVQFLESEQRAAVQAAADWGTYVMIHAYVPQAIQRAIRAGVRCIEHGQLADEETARMMAGEGVWWSLQPFLGDEDSNERQTPEAMEKGRQVAEGTVRAYELAQRLGVKVAWGTDILFSPHLLPHHGRQLAKMTQFHEPLEALRIATGGNGELLRMSGQRNPYDGPLGVIAPGALADILVAEGDPTTSLDFLRDPARNLKVIMKDGRMHKNTL